MKQIITTALIATTGFFLTGCGAFSAKVPTTTLTVNPQTHQIAWSNPKDTIINGLSASVGTNGVSTITINSISTVMNPTNIAVAGNAEAAIVTATGNAVVQALQSAGAAAGTAAGAVLKAP